MCVGSCGVERRAAALDYYAGRNIRTFHRYRGSKGGRLRVKAAHLRDMLEIHVGLGRPIYF